MSTRAERRRASAYVCRSSSATQMMTRLEAGDGRHQRHVGFLDLTQAFGPVGLGMRPRNQDCGLGFPFRREAKSIGHGSRDRTLIGWGGLGPISSGPAWLATTSITLALLEVHGEARIDPAVDRRPLALLAAARFAASAAGAPNRASTWACGLAARRAGRRRALPARVRSAGYRRWRRRQRRAGQATATAVRRRFMAMRSPWMVFIASAATRTARRRNSAATGPVRRVAMSPAGWQKQKAALRRLFGSVRRVRWQP